TDVTISAVQCWTSIEENLGVVPCTVMSMMSNELLSSACEVDICGVLGMHALQLASGTPSALLDWNNNYGSDPNKAVCFHWSPLPFMKQPLVIWGGRCTGMKGQTEPADGHRCGSRFRNSKRACFYRGQRSRVARFCGSRIPSAPQT